VRSAEVGISTVGDEQSRGQDPMADDATQEELPYRAYVREKIAAGTRAIEEGRTTSHREVKKRFHSSERST
jgi:predicted transcriptional regulator